MKKLFQYISCCCLSVVDGEVIGLDERFNTSHVVVYQTDDYDISLFLQRFNTSHVVVYPTVQGMYDSSIAVSIHLMLLFIGGLTTYS